MRLTLDIEKEHLPNCAFGLDEVGCAPLAGPVVAACVHVPRMVWNEEALSRVRDSKKVPKKERESLAAWLRENVFYGIGMASVDEIDALNILQASKLAMRRAFESCPKPEAALIALCDGHDPRNPNLSVETRMIKGGDTICLSIAAASIVAKTHRDALMARLAEDFPHYGWETNVGYPSKAHLLALQEFGPTVHHRKSFAPVRDLLAA